MWGTLFFHTIKECFDNYFAANHENLTASQVFFSNLSFTVATLRADEIQQTHADFCPTVNLPAW